MCISDSICTHILAFEGDSNVFYFEGSYSEYEENKQKRLGKEEPTIFATSSFPPQDFGTLKKISLSSEISSGIPQ